MIAKARKYTLEGLKVFVGEWFLALGYGGVVFFWENSDKRKYVLVEVDLVELEQEGFEIKEKIIKQTALNGKVAIKVLSN
jgi:hypothetical protein